MGVDTRAVAMFGVYFQTSNEAIEFVQQNGYPDVEAIDDLPEGVDLGNLTLECLDLYSGDHYILGFKYTLGETLDHYWEQWNALFPNSTEKPETQLEVAYY